MALERVVIQNFQSLKKVDLELGKFTVIVGPSSSGKSAFMRSIRVLASGIRGNSFITVGAKSASISAYTENHIITLEKSKTKAKYVITNRMTGEEETFTKLASSVPEAVTQALRLQPISKDQGSINFAAQHDMPYLLTDSAAQVAKVLGDLTNVSTIFEAVRQANKQKLATSTLLKTRQGDLESLLTQASQFSGLKDRKTAVEEAESALEASEALEARQGRLATLIESMEASEARIASYQELPEVPELDRLEELYSNYEDFKVKVRQWAQAYKNVQSLSSALEISEKEETAAHEALHARLTELGTCPTCGQDTTNEEALNV